MRIPSRGAGVVLALLLVLLVVPLPETGRVGRALQDLAHVPVGAVLALLVRHLLVRSGRLGHGAAAGAALGIVALVLAGVEGIQPRFGRGGSVEDALVGLGGAAGALVLRGALAAGGGGRAVRAAVGIALLAGAAFPAGRSLFDAWRQHRGAPLLASFEDDLELSRWWFRDALAVRVGTRATHGRRSLLIGLEAARYPAATLQWVPGDWRGYTALALDLHLVGSRPLELVLKIVDADHDGSYADRFHAYLELEPGANRVRIPLADVRRGPAHRELDLGRVRSVQLFADGLDAPRQLFLDHVRLER